jgi:thioredoxin-related protein
MNKLVPVYIILALLSLSAFAQDTNQNIYSAEANAVSQLDNAIKNAKDKKMHVLVVVGGDRCKWCKRFDKFITENYKIDSLIKADFIKVHINYSKENENQEAMTKLEYPQRFGFPVVVILDENGKRIHTQNTGYLEEGEGYSEDKILEFLKLWNKQALNPTYYQK